MVVESNPRKRSQVGRVTNCTTPSLTHCKEASCIKALKPLYACIFARAKVCALFNTWSKKTSFAKISSKILGCQNLGLLFCIEPRLILSCVCMCVSILRNRFCEIRTARCGGGWRRTWRGGTGRSWGGRWCSGASRAPRAPWTPLTLSFPRPPNR
jgi:hypothetical protein